MLYCYKTPPHELYFTPQYNYIVLTVFCMEGNITIHFSFLILFADLLSSVYPEPFKKVCYKEYIHHWICKSQYEGKWCIGSRKTVFSDLLKCTEQNSVVRMLLKYHRHTSFIVVMLNVLWLNLKVRLFTSFRLHTAL